MCIYKVLSQLILTTILRTTFLGLWAIVWKPQVICKQFLFHTVRWGISRVNYDDMILIYICVVALSQDNWYISFLYDGKMDTTDQKWLWQNVFNVTGYIISFFFYVVSPLFQDMLTMVPSCSTLGGLRLDICHACCAKAYDVNLFAAPSPHVWTACLKYCST